MILNYFKLLRKRDFFLLWLGQIISQFGDRLTQIALIGLVSQITRSSSGLALMMSMAIIPVFFISPISGVYIDRWDKRKTMYISDLLRGICIVSIPFLFLNVSLGPVIYIVIFLSFSVGRFFIPAKMAFIPRLIDKQEIFMANSLVSVTATVAAVLGFGLGGIIVEKYGIRSAFILDAATFFVSGALIFFIRTEGKGEFFVEDILRIGKDVVKSIKKSFVRELKEGVKYIVTSSETKYAFLIFLFLFSYIGGLQIVFIRFIQEMLSTVTKELGFIVVSLGAGIFFGSLVYGRIAHRFSIKKTINLVILIASVYIILFAIFTKFYPSSLQAIILAFFLGIIISPVFVGVNALIHRESEEHLLGRIFSGLEFTSHLGYLAAMFIFSFLADIFSPFTIIVSIGIIGSLLSFLFIFKNGQNRRI